MKVSASTLPDAPASRRFFLIPAVIAAVYFAAHLPFLAPSLEDVDSINFGLGLHDYDPARHQPHPPGYPVYIALGRMSLAFVSAVGKSTDRIAADALALAIWSALGGALALVAAAYLFIALQAPRSPIPDPRSLIPDPRSPIPDPRSPIPDPRSPIPDPRSPIPDPRSPIPDPRSLIPDPRSPIPDPCRSGRPPCWAALRCSGCPDFAR